jgi:serine/threonine-protein kinase
MATVYRAFQPSLAREVAIKVIISNYTHDPSFVERFQREARAIASLRHPNILTIHDFGQDPQTGSYYIVTELLEGKTLRDRLGQPLDLKKAAFLLGQIANALEYAHENGIVHRDVKPTNVLMDRRDRAVLADFGIAKLMQDTVNLTATGAGVGTPAYMSPEQSLGENLDGRSDQYSLGIVLYEMLTGTTPFRADTPVAMAMAHTSRPLPDPRQFNPRLSPQIVAVLQKALSKNPADRFPTIGQFAAAFEQAVSMETGSQVLPSQISDYYPTQAITPSQPGFYQSSPQVPPAQTPPPYGTGGSQPAQTPPPYGTGGSQPGRPPTNPGLPVQNQPAYQPANWAPNTPPPTVVAPPPGNYGNGYNQFTPPPTPPRRGNPWLLPVIGLVVIVAIAVVAFLVLNGNSNKPATSANQPAATSTAASNAGLATGGTATTANNASTSGTANTPGSGSSTINCATTADDPISTLTPGSDNGQLVIEVLETDCKPASGNDVYVKLYKPGDRGTVVAEEGYKNKLALEAPPGTYEAVVTYADKIQSTSQPFEIKQGQQTKQTVKLGVGHAAIEVLEADGKSANANDVYIKVYKPGDRNTVITEEGYKNKLDFVLKPGTYDFVVTYSNGLQLSQPVEVKEGQVTNQQVNFHVGKTTITVVETEGKSAKGDDVYIKVYKKGDLNTVVTEAGYKNSLSFILKPGSYEMVVTYGDGIKVTDLPLDIKEGENSSHEVSLHVGHLQVNITPPAGLTSNGNTVNVKIYRQGDRNTVIVDESYKDSFDFTLKPGTYEAVATFNDKEVTLSNIEVKEGQTVTQTAKF